jgi:hypothetical protein
MGISRAIIFEEVYGLPAGLPCAVDTWYYDTGNFGRAFELA